MVTCVQLLVDKFLMLNTRYLTPRRTDCVEFLGNCHYHSELYPVSCDILIIKTLLIILNVVKTGANQ